MSKQMKVEDKVYQDLDQLRVGRQTFSQVIADLLAARLEVFQLIDVLEGKLKYREWQRQELEKLSAGRRG